MSNSRKSDAKKQKTKLIPKKLIPVNNSIIINKDIFILYHGCE